MASMTSARRPSLKFGTQTTRASGPGIGREARRRGSAVSPTSRSRSRRGRVGSRWTASWSATSTSRAGARTTASGTTCANQAPDQGRYPGLTAVGPWAYSHPPSRTYVRFTDLEGVVVRGGAQMSKRYDEAVQVRVERDAGMPSAFVWRGRRYGGGGVIGRGGGEGP